MTTPSRPPTNLELPILFEDADLLVVNKPSGVVVNRAKSYPHPTVQDWLEEQEWFGRNQPGGQPDEQWRALVPDDFTDHYGTPQEIFAARSGMVHRLDKETSGALILAKNPGSLVNLLAQFKKRTVYKRYTCLVHGLFAVKSGVVDLPIARQHANRMRFGVMIDGRSATTEYQVISEYSGFDRDLLEAAVSKEMYSKIIKSGSYSGFSLVRCEPKTGRTHQIRVHMQHLQHPLVADWLYLGKKRRALDSAWCPRQFLHAAEVSFAHPRTAASLTVQAPLVSELEQVLGYLTCSNHILSPKTL